MQAFFFRKIMNNNSEFKFIFTCIKSVFKSYMQNNIFPRAYTLLLPMNASGLTLNSKREREMEWYFFTESIKRELLSVLWGYPFKTKCVRVIEKASFDVTCNNNNGKMRETRAKRRLHKSLLTPFQTWEFSI